MIPSKSLHTLLSFHGGRTFYIHPVSLKIADNLSDSFTGLSQVSCLWGKRSRVTPPRERLTSPSYVLTKNTLLPGCPGLEAQQRLRALYYTEKDFLCSVQVI